MATFRLIICREIRSAFSITDSKFIVGVPLIV